jgi:hypothetical protein
MPKLVYVQPVGKNLYLMTEVSAGHPDHGLPGEPGPTDPDYGVDEGAGPGHELPGRPPRPAQPLPPSWPGFPSTGPVFPGKPVDPGFGIPPGMVWWPVDPGFGKPVRPHPGHPDHGLPEPPTIPGVPDNTLPTTPPPTIPPNMILVIVRSPDGKWTWATVSAGTPPTPVQPIAPPPAQPDQGGPAPTPAPKTA